MQKLLGIFPVEVVVLCIIATISRPLIRGIKIVRFQNRIIPNHHNSLVDYLTQVIYAKNLIN